jgi:hypothetical protein
VVTDVSEVLTASTVVIVLIIWAANTSETSVSIYQVTQCNFPEDNHLVTSSWTTVVRDGFSWERNV